MDSVMWVVFWLPRDRCPARCTHGDPWTATEVPRLC